MDAKSKPEDLQFAGGNFVAAQLSLLYWTPLWKALSMIYLQNLLTKFTTRLAAIREQNIHEYAKT